MCDSRLVRQRQSAWQAVTIRSRGLVAK
uniref:Uncharacterized protein n=1 Tax=Arundo donax TaxID=35708 RepID=A0A0A9B6T1_ARUDO